MRTATALALFVVLGAASSTSAQDAPTPDWTWSARFSVGFMLVNNDWSVSHPTYGGGVVIWETFTGMFKHTLHLEGGLELRRSHFGVRGTVGFVPQRFTRDNPAEDADLTLLLAGLSAVVYPAANGARIDPFLLVGAGGQKASGDMDNAGFYLSTGAGLGTRLGSHLRLEAGLRVLRLKYTQIDLAPNIDKDVTIYPVSLFIGARVGN